MSRCKIIAELSMNHGGDMDLAEIMIASAANAGADYVKFQTWKCDRLKHGDWDFDGRREWYEKSELTHGKHQMLIEICNRHHITFLTSCFCSKDLNMIRDVSNEVKIPSTECCNKELVMQAIENFDTVYISTGTSSELEFHEYSKFDNVYLLHCVSIYPCPLNKINLHKINIIKELTTRYGYSGHALGVWDAIAAISMGCKVVEKHFTTDQNLPFRDNRFSILPEDLLHICQYATAFDEMSVISDTYSQELITKNMYSGRWSKDDSNV